MSSREARIVEASSQEFPFPCNSKVYITFSITKAVVRVGMATFPADTKESVNVETPLKVHIGSILNLLCCFDVETTFTIKTTAQC